MARPIRNANIRNKIRAGQIWLNINNRRTLKRIKPLHNQDAIFNFHKPHCTQTYGIRTTWTPRSENTNLLLGEMTLRNNTQNTSLLLTVSFMKPIEDNRMRKLIQPIKPIAKLWKDSYPSQSINAFHHANRHNPKNLTDQDRHFLNVLNG